MPISVQLPYDYTPRWYQEPVYNFAIRAGTDHADPDTDFRRYFCLDHRRAGKDLNWFNIMQCKAAQRVGTYAHIFPTLVEGRKVIWRGKNRDGRKFLDYIPGHREFIRKQRRDCWVVGKREDEMMIELANESIYQVMGADDPDSVRGMGIVGIIFSEYAFYKGPEMWDIVRPMLAENGGWAAFITTPDGRNHGHSLHMMAKKNPKWYEETLPASYTKAVDESKIQDDRESGMSEEKIASEYECSYDLPVEGSFFGPEMVTMLEEGRIGKVPHQPDHPVDTYWDIGVSDAMVIWFAQTFGQRHHLIHVEWMTGQGLPQAIAKAEEVARNRHFVFGKHLGPHDLKVRDVSTDFAKRRVEVARNLGFKFTVVPRQQNVQDGIDATRSLLSRTWIDEDNCQLGVDALRSYRRKKMEGIVGPRGEVLYGKDPEHNWASHFADGLRTGAMGLHIAREDKYRDRPPAPKIAIY